MNNLNSGKPNFGCLQLFTSVLFLICAVGAYAGQDKVDVCHITGTYDFGSGEIPIGHVINIADPAYPSHIDHGDPEVWDIVELPDGTEVCTASSSSSRVWDDFSTPSTPVELTVSSEGTERAYIESETEHYLDSTRTLRAFRIRHAEHDDGISVSQWGAIGNGLVDYTRTVSPTAYTNDFFELQYDNASGTSSLGGERFDVTDEGTYDHMVFHFRNLQASTTYQDGDTGEYMSGARMCLFFYTDSPYYGYMEFKGHYLVAGGGACRGVLLTDDTDFEVEISYLDDFVKEVPYECGWVEEGSMTPEEFEYFFGTPYEETCDHKVSLSDFQSLYGIIMYIDGADAVTLSGITLEDRSIDTPNDLDGDGIVDLNDISIINTYRNQPAGLCPDCDIDGDGTITVLDARQLMMTCTYPSCASN